jgi:hypothetical protein
MRIFFFALALAIGGSSVAQARCSDDFKELQARIDRQMQQQPPQPQVAAAAKQLKKASDDMDSMDEVDCYNAVARVRRTLATPVPPQEVKDAIAAKPR